ncbi:hypothetical protein HFQ13_12040 [Acidithiobacillus sp. VAN18-1]|uniref:DUF5681 domain-containing protein n=1 Tax=Igneacidithiobacillus copahuensis TaxID=2724909 RepID=A0AAE2YRU6_9PROT|nr:hypothetical protein [Igneacidithiobacillus copahuensis]MBU2788921.1 hypothetical protein [Igneacidithiobacillus copahuensis]MBU2795542.1 hypothetical protein [Acidithiobacillus sp. VAN18-2]
MSDKQTAGNGHRGQFLPGNPGGPGRPKGRGNLFPMTLKDDILEAYQQLGGIAWLVQLGREEPKTFAALLARLLPKQIEAGIEVTQSTGPTRIEMVIIDPPPCNVVTIEEIKAELARNEI